MSTIENQIIEFDTKGVSHSAAPDHQGLTYWFNGRPVGEGPSGWKESKWTAVSRCAVCRRPAICADRSAEWAHGRLIVDYFELSNRLTSAADVDIPARFLRGFDEPVETVYSALFGVLVQLAQPHLERFYGDLFYDAKWIEEYVDGPLCFFFGADESGTAIGTDSSLVRQARKHVWQIQLVEIGRGWYVRIAKRYER